MQVATRKRTAFALVALTVLSAAALAAVSPATAGPLPPGWEVQSVDNVGCNSSDIDLTMLATNVAGGSFRARTRVTAGGLTYMDEDAGVLATDGNYSWSLYNSSSGGPTDASFPIAADTEVRTDFTLENPIGTVFTSWTLILDSCNAGNVLYNGLTSQIPEPTTTTTEAPTTTTAAPTTVTAPRAAAAPVAVVATPAFTG